MLMEGSTAASWTSSAAPGSILAAPCELTLDCVLHQPEEPWQWYDASINSVINYDVSLCSVTGLDNTTSHTLRVGLSDVDSAPLTVSPPRL